MILPMMRMRMRIRLSADAVLRRSVRWLVLISLAFPMIASAQGIFTPRERACSAVNAATNVTGNRVHDTLCGAFGTLIGNACERLNPYPDFGDYWKNCVSCVLDDNCDENWGDPHFVTGDGLRFDFQGQGDYAIVVADDLEIQARYVGERVSIQTGVAVSTGERVIAVENTGSVDENVYLDGALIALEEGAWYDFDSPTGYVQRVDDAVRIVVADQVAMVIEGSRLTMRVDDSLDDSRRGLFGNGNGDPGDDLATANGALVDAANLAAIYGEYQQSWRREGGESLFETAFTPPNDDRASAVPALADFDQGVRDAARQVCLVAGVVEEGGLDECVYDIVVTGSEALVLDAVAAAARVSTSVGALGFSTESVQQFTLADLGSVSPGLPGGGAGNIDQRYATDRYQVGLPSDAPRALLASQPCDDGRSLKMLVTPEGGAARESVLDCQRIVSLPSAPTSLSVFSSAGDLGDYSFRIVEPTVVDLGLLPSGEIVEGQIDGQIARGQLTRPGDGRLYVEALEGASCDTRWQIIDGAGAALTGSVPACRDLGSVTLGQATPHTLEITALRELAAYRFRIVSPEAAVAAAAAGLLPEPTPEMNPAVDPDVAPPTMTGPASVSGPSVAAIGTRITVSWTGPANPTDFIAIAEAGADDNVFVRTSRISAETDTVTLDVPGTPGAYEIRYILNDGRRVLASQPLMVTAAEASVQSAASAPQGSRITVTWTGPGSQFDFIAIAEAGAVDNAFVRSRRVDQESNTVELDLPGIPGNYEIRYIVNENRVSIASQPIVVLAAAASVQTVDSAAQGSPITVTWTGPGSQFDFIAIAEAGADDNRFVRSRRVDQQSNTVELDLPGIPGNYEIRYIVNEDRVSIASRPITVLAAAASVQTVDSAAQGSRITVTWTGPGSQFDFIAIAEAGADDNAFVRSRRVDQQSNTVELDLPGIPGNYEIRYIVNEDRVLIASRPITVLAAAATVQAANSAPQGSTIAVTWTGPGSQFDFIAIAEVGAEDNSFTQTRRVSPDSNVVMISLPDTPGAYEIRYIVNEDRQVIASRPLQVLPGS